jgi:hypothetical protein
MMRRSGVADPGPLGDRTEREGLHPAFGQFRLGRDKQGVAQVAMVVGRLFGSLA